MMKRLQTLRRQSKGAVLLETALVVLLLMGMVIGMGSIAIQGQDLENRGRVAREVADYVRVYAEETNGLNAQGVDGVVQLASDRLRARPEDFRIVMTRVRRDVETGAFVVVGEWTAGGYDQEGGLEVQAAQMQADGINLPLDLGDELWVVEAITRFTGIPRGTQPDSARHTWAVVPVVP